MFRTDIESYQINFFGMVRGIFTLHTIYSIMIYRIGNFFAHLNIKFLPDFFKGLNQLLYSCDISSYAQIGSGFRIHHSVGVVIGHAVKIGDNCEIFQNVTIGSNRKFKGKQEMPILGNNVTIYAGAIIVGPISIGDNCIIGAGCFVDFDVPDNTIVKREKIEIVKERNNG